MTITVITALGPHLDAGIVALIERAPGVEVSRRCADLPELLSVGAAGIADVAAVSADVRGLDRDAIRQLAGYRVAVVGVVAVGDEDGERRLRQLGVRIVVTSQISPAELSDRLTALPAVDESDGWLDALPSGDISTHALSAAPLPNPADDILDDSTQVVPVRGRVTAVWGPTGAPGRTTLAVTLAHRLATTGRRVLLVDLDMWGACVGQALGLLDEAPGIAAAARLSEQGLLDVAALARISPEAAPRLRVLTGLSDAARWPEVRAGSVDNVLDIARSLAEHVIVDCGFSVEDDEELSYDTRAPRRNGATLAALAHADDLLVVGAADPVGLQRLVRAVQALDPLDAPAPTVIVNKVRAAVAGPRPESAIAGVLGRFAGLGQVHFLPWDPDACDGALLAGRSLVEQAPEAPLTKAIGDLLPLLGVSEQVNTRRAARSLSLRGRALRR